MGDQILSIEPDTFAAGETIQWRRSYGDYLPSAGWALRFFFVGPDLFQVAAANVNGEWLATIAPADTATKKAGTYQWTAYAELGVAPAVTERRRVASGTLILTPNMTTAAAGDLTPFAERMLPIIEAAIAGRLTVDQQSMQIDGTAIVNIPIVELTRLRAQFRAAVWRKRNPGKIGQPILLSFPGTR